MNTISNRIYILIILYQFKLVRGGVADGQSNSETISAPQVKFQCGLRNFRPFIQEDHLKSRLGLNVTNHNSTSTNNDTLEISTIEDITLDIVTKPEEETTTSTLLNESMSLELTINENQTIYNQTANSIQQDFNNSLSTEKVYIIGGSRSRKNSWPWMALLWKERNSQKEFFCSGVLINENYIITAAHCVLELVTIYVRLGEHNVNVRSKITEDFEILEFIFHPNYEINQGYHDIALLKLKRSVELKKTISPICLPWDSTSTENYTGERVKVAGWGSTTFGGQQSHNLQEVDLIVFETSRCERSYSPLPGFRSTFPFGMTPENILCAGHDDGGKDACNGDSGGPLIWKNEVGVHTMIGLVSKGYGCGKKDFPGLYAPLTNVQTLKWIKENAFKSQ